MTLNLTPCLDYIFVRKTEEKLAGGLYLAAPADPTAPRYAEVVAVGPGRPSEYSAALIEYRIGHHGFAQGTPVSEGQTVLMHGGAGTKIKVDGEELWAILPRDLIGVVPT